MKYTNIDFNKDRVKQLIDYYGAKGISPEQAQIRIETALENGKGKYQFNLKKEILSGAEQNIQRNDLFVLTHLLIALSVEVDAKPGQNSLLTYPLIEGLNVPTLVNAFTTRDIEALYNGFLSIKTGQVVNVSALPLINFRKVPAVQPLALLQPSDDAVVSNGAIPEFDLSDVALQMTERIIFAGTQDHKVEIEFPTDSTSDFSTATADSTTKVVFIALGYKVPGGTSEEFKNDKSNPFRNAI